MYLILLLVPIEHRNRIQLTFSCPRERGLAHVLSYDI
jgi:hypothetical protein